MSPVCSRRGPRVTPRDAAIRARNRLRNLPSRVAPEPGVRQPPGLENLSTNKIFPPAVRSDLERRSEKLVIIVTISVTLSRAIDEWLRQDSFHRFRSVHNPATRIRLPKTSRMRQ